ncbi:hypothetical protein IWQ60_004354 [Tieghemiomyces parasiticus]|uniref:Uncharacterized protein n=1 Tax=Tieghemiomyces parasiticus TaxID=78921 RepID=A0A9W8DZ79_9FUNG|nr:hypothetical protein IWQ60_004354 [Tieghemiomyces parasiticus]
MESLVNTLCAELKATSTLDAEELRKLLRIVGVERTEEALEMLDAECQVRRFQDPSGQYFYQVMDTDNTLYYTLHTATYCTCQTFQTEV